ncbi:AAA family ATPase [Idiomarina tyrosinivorans]|nr:AAA family ATPase [Idiomarina tyrosinivorans]
MKLKKLELKNFRQFYGEQTVEFSTSKTKNVTLIHAENGVGKTAFLNAILWCLFETFTENFKDQHKLLNDSAKDEGLTTYFVAIDFIDEDERHYYAKRIYSGSTSKFMVYEIKNGQHTSEISNPNSFINSIIPKDMARYFFFQGEGLNSTSGKQGNSIVREAIRKILGFTVAEEALKDLKKIKQEFRNKANSADKTGDIRRLQTQIQAIEEEVSSSNSSLEKSQQAVEEFEEKVKKIDSILMSSNSETVKSLHRERTTLENNLVTEKQRLKDELTDRRKLIAKHSTVSFSQRLSKEALDFIKEEEYKGSIPAPFNQQLVKDIIDQAKCICGREVHPNSSEFNTIQNLLKQASNPELEQRVMRARAQLINLSGSVNESAREFKLNIERVGSSERRVEEIKDKLQEVSTKISGTKDITAIKRFEEDRLRLKSYLDQSHSDIGKYKQLLESAKKRLYATKEELKRLDTASGDLAYYRKTIDYIENIENYISQKLYDSEKSVEQNIILLVNNYLKKFVTKDYKAKLNQSTYDIRLVDRVGNTVPESDGENLLLGLTFISALIELSKQRKNASGQIFTPGAIAPFVIDAPFGVLDNKYKGNISKAIPEAVDQVIFLLSSSHWEGSVEDNIRDKVGREFNMVAEVSSPAESKQDIKLKIRGEEFDRVRYSCAVDRTIIEEVTVND